MSRRYWAMGVAAAILASAGIMADEAPPAAYKLNIGSQPMDDALNEFARQSGLQVILQTEEVKGMTAPRVEGTFTARDALGRLLENSGLEFEYLNERTVAVRGKGAVEGRSGALGVYWGDGVRLAQTEQTLPAGSSGSVNSVALEEVIVTATKREEPLQDIPLSVSVLDEQTLIKQGATDLTDYARRVPNLAFAAGVGGGYSFQIRGVSGAGTTGTYIDDVPVPEGMNPRIIDIARIEVLRGPQGTLYGSRSMGGAVRLITKRADPTTTEFQTHAYLGAVAEGDQDYTVDSAVNVPLSSNLAFRGNLYYQQETGFRDIVVNNPTVTGDEITHKNADDGEYRGFQAMATWTPTEHLTIEPRFMYQRSHVDWYAGSDLSPGNFTNSRVVDLADPEDTEWSISSLTVSWDTDWGRFTSATAFLDSKAWGGEEFSEFMSFMASIPRSIGGVFIGGLGADETGTPDYYPIGGSLLTSTNKSSQITEEVRFTSAFDGPLQIAAGIFYSKQKNDIHAPCSFALGLIEATGIPYSTECIYAEESQNGVKETAVFGELEYAVLDNLFLTLGGRYFENTITSSGESSGLFGGGVRPDYEHSEDGFNPKVALKWEATPDWTLYSSASQGYRLGGENGVVPPTCGLELATLGLPAVPPRYKSDSLWSYEVGSKSAHANGRFALNAAAFFIDWNDTIQSINLSSCGFGYTANLGKAEVKGAEVEITGQAVDHLHYSLGVGYADSKIADTQNVPFLSKGQPLSQVPEWTFSGNVEYRFSLGAAREGYFFLSYSWVDSSISRNQGQAVPGRVREAYDVVDARLGTTFGKWDVSLSGKNLTNEHPNLSDHISAAAEAPGRPRYATSRPRTIGVDVRWVF